MILICFICLIFLIFQLASLNFILFFIDCFLFICIDLRFIINCMVLILLMGIFLVFCIVFLIVLNGLWFCRNVLGFILLYNLFSSILLLVTSFVFININFERVLDVIF